MLCLFVLLSGGKKAVEFSPRKLIQDTVRQPEQKIKDSIIIRTKESLNTSLQVLERIPKKQDQLVKFKRREHKALTNYVNLVNLYVQKTSRKKVVTESRTLKADEVKIVRDSTCSKTRTPLFGKQKCVEYAYTFYIVDFKGNKTKIE